MTDVVVTETSGLFPPLAVPEDLRQLASERGWREDLVQRGVDLRIRREELEWSFNNRTDEEIDKWLAQRERLAYGTLRGRVATWEDDVAFRDLWRNSPETIGDWEVVVEREPFAYAQFALHENVSIRMIEDRGLMLACGVISYLNAYVAGRPLGLRFLSGWRVREGFRGSGYTRLIQHVADNAVTSRWAQAQFFYVRTGNLAAEVWMDKLVPGFLDNVRIEEGSGLAAEVLQYPARPFEASSAGIRKATPSDVARCVTLINCTHRGLDLFRPYTKEFLSDKLTEWSWAPKPEWWTHVYSWDDYWVLESDGRIVACAGLWDKGAHVREVWRHKDRDERKVLETSCIVDFGFARGREDAMARLIAFCGGETAKAGREFVLAPLQWLPRVAKQLEALEPVPERRGVVWNVFDPQDGFMKVPDPVLSRPYTDLGYW